MRRGDVYWAAFEPARGGKALVERPVVILSRNAINQHSPAVVVAPIVGHAGKKRLYPSHVLLKAGEGGVPKDSVILGEQVSTISKKRLKKLIGHLPNGLLEKVDSAMKIVLDLP